MYPTLCKSFSTLVSALLISLLLSACQPRQPDDLLTISGPFEAVSLAPSKSGYVYTRMQILETLINTNDAGELLPGLAQSWEIGDQNRRWTLHLRPQVTFHNGAPLTADTVAHSLQTALGHPGPLLEAGIDSIRAVDPDTVVIQLQQPYLPFTAVLAHYSTAILAPESYADNGDVVELYGTGPYQLTEYTPPHKVKVSRFDEYWGTPAIIAHAEYLTGHRSESRALMVKSGEADIVYNLDPASVDLLKKSDHVQIDSTLIPRSILIKVNNAHPFLNDLKTRKALSLAIDRQGIAANILGAPGTAASQFFGPTMHHWHLAGLPEPVQDLEQAKTLLAEAGWKQSEDGTLIRNGQPFQLRMITYANRPELMLVATAIQAQWAELGIRLDVSMENASAIPSGHADGSLQLALIARNFANIPDPLGTILADFSTAAGGDWGPMNWNNAKAFSLLSAMKTEADANVLAQQRRLLSALLAEDLPMIPVSFYVQQSAVAKRVNGFHFDPFERSFRIAEMNLANL
ncbi:ABC transporter substrate-binding protein [Gynuella sunshinyii]|uniref:ABC-type dipeptide transport system, periplasmic component n=1 Tax=Gynuella sunshinyii YC6258 TaxID=1445510 RepID=A0A0C5V4D1_9GAMM|nr:ABC transporter substrate-binding protein [Gynuella sunshinyii]AJQ94330.1 ABC-type dipeptide transport system, periplasmic component [Gynuella sunshinyii YC6258]